jgi:hypothetical protein
MSDIDRNGGVVLGQWENDWPTDQFTLCLETDIETMVYCKFPQAFQ